uniref:Uncharacterized protein n=1 Tax=Anopheles atroparvus TaxID=41427 RepID=A0A182JB95_ANOAO
MPTQKKKDKKPKAKSDSKAAVNIKQEPEEIKPLASYVDDRLELIRQVFSCVKPKEIKYLLPDFLEGKSNDVIKERCLDELLGISTKRLVSIINNTKCPTDTESENSDVENIEEHISLDEISSDSDVDAKRAGKRNKKAENNKQPDERNGEAKSEKEMTVLELLELQARARAIRSQLALEPVTKIEIDSEHEEDGRQGDIDTDDEGKQGTQKRTAAKDGVGAAGSGENGKPMKQEQNAQQQTKRVRLKRNFRIRQVGDDDEEELDPSSNPSESAREKSADNAVEIVETTPQETVTVEEKEKSPENDNTVDAEKLPEAEKPETAGEPVDDAGPKVAETENVEETSKDPIPVAAAESTSSPTRDADRESSPEVIPVEASPETLCISSDSEEERLAKQRASIFVPNIDELDRQAKQQAPASSPKPVEDTEPEEGEISEDEAEVPAPAEEPVQTVEDQLTTDKENPSDPNTSAVPMETEADQKENAIEGNGAAANDKNVDSSTQEVVEQETAGKDTTADSAEIHNLSSGSDESDSESGDSSSSSSTEEEQTKTEPPKLDTSAQDDEDIVEIHDSGDENLLLDEKPAEEEEKSWNSRWLKSNRVAKVMAASRLGNKVREKLKKKKQIQQAEQLEQATTEATEPAQPSPKAAEPATAVELPSNVELGSVEHYRELVAQQENKD